MGFVDNTALFCKSKDLIETTGLGNETSFCTISGRSYNIIKFDSEIVCMQYMLVVTTLDGKIHFSVHDIHVARSNFLQIS